jgi:hypothetical protein
MKEPEILRYCDKILASPGFADSPRVSSFLRYVVDLAVTGREADIKEFAIGVDVFGRTADFDPKTDPIVRVQAGRLRLKLAEYYGGEGREDLVRIEVPKGSYIPKFERTSPTHQLAQIPANPAPSKLHVLPPVQRRPATPFAIGALSILVVALALGWWWTAHSKRPTTIGQLRRLTHDFAKMPTLSPDGKLLAYVSDRAGDGKEEVWLQQMSGGEAVRLTRMPEQEWTPTFSPDGTTIAFWYAGIRPRLPEEGSLHRPRSGRRTSKTVSRLRGKSALFAGWQLDRLHGRHARALLALSHSGGRRQPQASGA